MVADPGHTVVDEGLLDWLGVNRSADCNEASLNVLFNQSGGTTSLLTQMMNAYGNRSDPRTWRFRYRVSLRSVRGTTRKHPGNGAEFHRVLAGAQKRCPI